MALHGASLGGPVALAQEPPERATEFVDKLIDSLGPREKVSQLFIVGFEGPEVGPEIRQFITDHKVGGIFLSRESCNIVNGTDHDPAHCGFPDEADPDTPGQVARLTLQLQQAACDGTKGSVEGVPYCLPLFITIDHEGDDRPQTRLVNRSLFPAPGRRPLVLLLQARPWRAATSCDVRAPRRRSIIRPA